MRSNTGSVTPAKIRAYYRAEAAKFGLSGTSTIVDLRTRRIEIEAISFYLRDGMRVLEVGCGNGYTAVALARAFKVTLDAFDFCHDLVRLAKQRALKKLRGQVHFKELDVLRLAEREKYDLVFTERSLQNLVSWEAQKRALKNIARALKSEGFFIMLESFRDSLKNLNQARAELGLSAIKQQWKNRFFDETETKRWLEKCGCRFVDQNCFLSGYYFGSRVLLPALMPRDREAKSRSILNDYFCHLPPHGDFSPMKILRFQKRPPGQVP